MNRYAVKNELNLIFHSKEGLINLHSSLRSALCQRSIMKWKNESKSHQLFSKQVPVLDLKITTCHLDFDMSIADYLHFNLINWLVYERRGITTYRSTKFKGQVTRTLYISDDQSITKSTD